FGHHLGTVRARHARDVEAALRESVTDTTCKYGTGQEPRARTRYKLHRSEHARLPIPIGPRARRPFELGLETGAAGSTAATRSLNAASYWTFMFCVFIELEQRP